MVSKSGGAVPAHLLSFFGVAATVPVPGLGGGGGADGNTETSCFPALPFANTDASDAAFLLRQTSPSSFPNIDILNVPVKRADTLHAFPGLTRTVVSTLRLQSVRRS